MVPTPVASRDTVFVAGSGWLDVSRSLELWRSFAGPPAIVKRGAWIDRPSATIPFAYLLAGGELWSALSDRREAAAADTLFGTLLQVARASRLDSLLSIGGSAPPALRDTSR